MTERRLPIEELTQTRFATSPLWETAASLRVLQSRDAGLHEAWAGPARERVREAGLDLTRLLAVVPPTGRLADIATPTPRRRHGDIHTELEAVSAWSVEALVEDLTGLLAEVTPPAAAVLLEGLENPPLFRERLAADLEAYWELTVSRVWDRLEGLAESDISWRLERLAAGGVRAVLDTLHPRVRTEGDALVISNACDSDLARGHGVVLVPCAFGWPDLLFMTEAGRATTLSYAPRGVGNLWRTAPDVTDTPLAELVGRTRAAAVVLLDLPMTTGQLACHLDLTPPSASSHLKILARAGLVTATRRGKRVLYSRTDLGTRLADAGSPPAVVRG